jgi:hypothetical protein
MADDPVAATLAGIRERQALAADASLGFSRMNERHDALIKVAYEDTPRLLAVVEAALKLHARQDKPVRSWDQPCDAHLKAIGTLRLGDRPGAFGAIRDCPDCRYTEYYVCSHCTCPNDTWPCPTVEAIRTALLGEEAGDGG